MGKVTQVVVGGLFCVQRYAIFKPLNCLAISNRCSNCLEVRCLSISFVVIPQQPTLFHPLNWVIPIKTPSGTYLKGPLLRAACIKVCRLRPTATPKPQTSPPILRLVNPHNFACNYNRHANARQFRNTKHSKRKRSLACRNGTNPRSTRGNKAPKPKKSRTNASRRRTGRRAYTHTSSHLIFVYSDGLPAQESTSSKL